MKKYNKYIISLILVVTQIVFFGCDSFLEPEAKGFINPASFFKNEADAEAAVLSGYRTFGSDIPGSFGWHRDFVFEVMHDDFIVRPNVYNLNNVGRDSEFIDFTPTRGPIEWGFYNVGIINTFSWAIDGISGIEDFARKNELIAEAKFLRAYNYFIMVRLFGGLPVIEKSLVNADEASNIPRKSKEEVYDLIIRDLTAGTSDLPPTNMAGRPTKYSAMGLLSQVYLTLGQWSDAASWAKKVINESDRILLPSVWDPFNAYEENTAESLFEIQYKLEVQRANQVGNWPRGIGVNSDQDYFLGPNWGGIYVATNDLLSDFEEGDIRREMIATQVTRDNGEVCYFNADNLVPNYPIKRVSRKYINGEEANNNSSYNFIALRLAEIYLIAAEAENEANGPVNALQYINPIRNRAGLPNLQDSNPAAANSQDAFRTAVRKERRTELFDERVRYFDLLRWGTLVERVKAVKPNAQIQPHHVLWPIPQYVFERNEGMSEEDQNPGY